jgi:GntR family transcriptional regulator
MVHNTPVLPFRVQFKAGAPAYEQVVYAVKKAIITGALKPGDNFPSVRSLSQELRINPNTAQKVVAALTADGLLRVRPGIGTVIVESRPATREQLADLLGDDLERLVVEAQKLHLNPDDVVQALRQHWNRLERGQK